LTDLVMPVMGGEELRDAVHQLKPDMAILFMTGYAPPHSLAWVQQQPNRLQLIQKPFSADDILARIGEMLAS
jgi:FixJ family two-component response regulator